MSRLLSRILLSMFAFPLAALVYLVAYAVVEDDMPDEQAMIVSGVLTWLVIACYWVALWFGPVRWTQKRVMLTTVSAGVSVLVAAVIGWPVEQAERDVGYFVASAAAPLFWLISTALVWRESDAERAARHNATGGPAVLCPQCAYNLAGLRSASCPECGWEGTLDQLLAAQPGREQQELEQ